MADYLNIAGRIRTTASDGVAMEAHEVKDLNLNKSQQEVNADVQNDLGDRYTKEETYNRDQLNELITTPGVNRVYVIATNLTTAVTDLLPATGSSDALYNVGNWDGTQYDTTVYSIYGWDGTAYVCLAVRSSIGEVYDISANHPDGQGNPTPYADLTAALGTGGANVPVGIRRGGMSIKFIQGTVQSSDNKYVRYNLLADSFTTEVTQWQGVDDKPIINSKNLTESGGIANAIFELQQEISDINPLTRNSYEDNSWFNSSGQIKSANTFRIDKYQVGSGKIYTFSGKFSSGVNIFVLAWFDSNDNFIKTEPYNGSETQATTWSDIAIIAPEGASYLWMNVEKGYSSSFSVTSYTAIKSKDLENAIEQNIEDIAANKHNIDQNTADISELTLLTPDSVNEGHWFKSNGTVASSNDNSIAVYNVIPGNRYTFSGKYYLGVNIFVLAWYDSNNNFIKTEPYSGSETQATAWSDIAIIAPEGASYLWMNVLNYYSSKFNLTSVGDSIKSMELRNQINQNTDDIEQNTDDIEQNTRAISEAVSSELTATVLTGQFPSRIDGHIINNSNIDSYVFDTINPTKIYKVKDFGVPSSDYNNVAFVNYYNGDTWIGIDSDFFVPAGPYYQTDYAELINIPTNCNKIVIITYKNYTPKLSETIIGNRIKSQDLKKQIEQLQEQNKKLMKVVINEFEGVEESVPFYVRTRYNSEKDLITTHRINGNTLISFGYTYVGPNNLTDAQLMTNEYLVSSHTDSTAALFRPADYWALFAAHGYNIPYIDNTTGLTTDDVGSEWKDQLDRVFHIGKVTENYVYLLPLIYKDANNHDRRDWISTGDSPAITQLIHVSGGVHTTTIAVGTNHQTHHLRPIMEHYNRKFIVDGNETTETGIYYCNDFSVSESQKGYDPATISDWFGGEGGVPVLSGASVMMEFTYCYNYRGAQCAMNTTINILRPITFYEWGAIQQQFFFDTVKGGNTYKAMFMIPKAAARNGVEIDKPFNSPSASSPEYAIYRTSNSLKDVDDPVDRQIGYLFDDVHNDYLVGMAAGLSLVSGDTVKAKRIQNCPAGSTQSYRLLLFSPLNTNKFYITGINSGPFADNHYYFPIPYFKEIDTYICYFDPAENVGQVYWYKDGSRYIIYAHCQSVQNVLAINVPEFMDGLSLSVVEKTTNTDLLSDTIQNGKFFVNYNTNDANYIVLIAQ